jgi:hypothetical protein
MKRNERRDLPPEALAQIIHALPHRVRILAPLLASRAEVCRRIAENLAQSPSFPIEKITVHVITGSIIVEAPPGTIDTNALLAHLRACIEAEVKQFPVTISGPTRIARSVSRAFSALNADVRGGLHHRADLAALLPVVLATLGAAQIVTTGRVPAPAWFNFCWWSFRSFLTFHKDVADEEDEGPHDAAQNVDTKPPA